MDDPRKVPPPPPPPPPTRKVHDGGDFPFGSLALIVAGALIMMLRGCG